MKVSHGALLPLGLLTLSVALSIALAIAVVRNGGMIRPGAKFECADVQTLIWSSVVDAPVSFGVSAAEIEAEMRECYGLEGVRNFAERMARVEAHGTSAIGHDDVDDTIWLNRAGPDEIAFSKAEIIEWYVRRKEQPNEAEVMKRRATMAKCDPCVAGIGEDFGQMCRCWGTGVVEPEIVT